MPVCLFIGGDMGPHMGAAVRCLLLYNSDVFQVSLRIGKTYTFYGEVAEYTAGYSGSLRIDFFE